MPVDDEVEAEERPVPVHAHLDDEEPQARVAGEHAVEHEVAQRDVDARPGERELEHRDDGVAVVLEPLVGEAREPFLAVHHVEDGPDAEVLERGPRALVVLVRQAAAVGEGVRDHAGAHATRRELLELADRPALVATPQRDLAGGVETPLSVGLHVDHPAVPGLEVRAHGRQVLPPRCSQIAPSCGRRSVWSMPNSSSWRRRAAGSW